MVQTDPITPSVGRTASGLIEALNAARASCETGEAEAWCQKPGARGKCQHVDCLIDADEYDAAQAAPEPFITASNPRVLRLAQAIEANREAAWPHSATEAPKAVVIPRRKYIALDLDFGSYRTGHFLIEGERVWNVKAYGRKGRYAGTLDELTEQYEEGTRGLEARNRELADRTARLNAAHAGTYRAGE